MCWNGMMRIFFILARNSPTAVVFRRGPSKWVQVLKWDTDTDTFEAGQWFHGKIYERRSDLSLDGSMLISELCSQERGPSQGYAR